MCCLEIPQVTNFGKYRESDNEFIFSVITEKRPGADIDRVDTAFWISIANNSKSLGIIEPGNYCDLNNDGEYRARKRFKKCELSVTNWDMCDNQIVSELPIDIDHLCKYKILCSEKEMMSVTKDGRPWDTWVTSSRKDFYGIRRNARCKGSALCLSSSCPYQSSYGTQNKVHFQKKADLPCCFTCRSQNVPCHAVKIWAYERSNNSVSVMHANMHTCTAKARKIDRKEIIKMVRENPGTKSNKLVHDKIVQIISTDNFNPKNVNAMTENFGDAKRICNVHSAEKELAIPVGQNIDALALLKSKCDHRDKFLIYRINNRTLNEKPSFVCKSSRDMAEIAVCMN